MLNQVNMLKDSFFKRKNKKSYKLKK